MAPSRCFGEIATGAIARRRSTSGMRPTRRCAGSTSGTTSTASIERGYGGRSIFWDKRPGPRRPDARRRVRPPAGLARHQRLLHQQRQRQPARARRRTSSRRSRASPTRFRPWGVRVALRDRLRQPAIARRARHLRSARSRSDRLVEGARRRALRAPFPTSAASC